MSKRAIHPALSSSLLHFVKLDGIEASARSMPYHQWACSRRKAGVWPFSRVLMGRVGHQVRIADEFGNDGRNYINFGSQDYLGLAQRSELGEAACRAIHEFGVHSAGSPVLCGRTKLLLEVEAKLCTALGSEACLLFPTGWAAGFGVIAGLVRPDDSIVMDALCHNCLQEGARHATTHVRKFRHNSVEHLSELLAEERMRNPHHGVFLVIESLYSMDSDSPPLAAMMEAARAHEAVVILDVAHDFGAMHEDGLGLLGTIPRSLWPDVIMGSFSKTFAANGGFVAGSAAIKEYLAFHSPPHIFSNAISPMQCAVISRACDIVFSKEGQDLRGALLANIHRLRHQMAAYDMGMGGHPSPIVPVFVGEEPVARLVSKHMNEQGLLANLVNFRRFLAAKRGFAIKSWPSMKMNPSIPQPRS